MKISVVTTLYYSEQFVAEFYHRVVDSLNKITDEYEIIFVNDGSPDDSLQVALSLRDSDENVKIIDLSRNFGHHRAVMTGLSHANGDYIFLIDVDLEEEPELLDVFYKEIHNSSYDVIYGVQKNRKGDIFEKVTGYLFFKIFNFFSDIKLPVNAIMARLMTKKFVENLKKHKERELVFIGLCELTGFNQKGLLINKNSKGSTTYNLKRKIDMAITSITSFSSNPLLYLFYMGITISVFSFLFILFIVVRKLFFGVLAGWTSLVASIWFIGGVTIACIGVVGIYLSKVFIEVKERPYTIINEIYGASKKRE